MLFRQFLKESELKFWKEIYKNDETHWLDKSPSNLAKLAIRKYGPFKNVLEIGCAGGIDSFLFAEHCNKLIGIDIVPEAIEIANKNLQNKPQKIRNKIKFEVGDAEKMKFSDKSFDFVYSLSVLHSTNINSSIPEIRRVLTDDGHAVIYVYLKTDKTDEGIEKYLFINACKDKFKIEKTTEHEIASDDGGDSHVACIVFFEEQIK